MAGYREFDELISPKTNLLRYIQKGVLWVQERPLYIVELIKESDISYVMVYKVHPGTEKNPQKLAVEVVNKQNVFSPTTILGQLATKFKQPKVTKKWVPKDPVFVAPVISDGLSTFTGERGPGFFERDEDRISVEGGKRKVTRGKNTGIFIGLSSIVWEDRVSIPTDSLLKTLTQYRQEMFYDFEGNNSSLDNPLSTYYEGGKL